MLRVDKLRHRIDEVKLSKVDLCERARISRTALDAILKGGDVRISTLESIAEALGVGIEYFFNDEIINNQFNNYGKGGIQASKIDSINYNEEENKKTALQSKSTDELIAQIMTLQKELLEARDEIINLLKKRE